MTRKGLVSAGSVGPVMAGSAVRAAAGILVGFVGARALGPAPWGAWQAALVALRWSTVGSLGAFDGLQRQLGLMTGRGKSRRRRRALAGVALLSGFPGLLLSAVILTAFALLSATHELAESLLAIAVVVIVNGVAQFGGKVLRATQRFRVIGLSEALDGIVHLAALALVIPFGLTGFLGGQILRFVAVAAFVSFIVRGDVEVAWDRRRARILVADGAPIMGSALVDYIFWGIDRILVVSYLGAASLGLYSLAGIILAPVALLQHSIIAVFYPALTERYGASASLSDLRTSLIMMTRTISGLWSVCATVLVLLAGPVVSLLLPDFLGGVPAAKWLICSQALLFSAAVSGTVLTVVGHQIHRLLAIGAGAMANFLGGLIVLGPLTGGLVDVAVVSTASSALSAAALAHLAARAVGMTSAGEIRLLTESAALLALPLTAVLLTGQLP